MRHLVALAALLVACDAAETHPPDVPDRPNDPAETERADAIEHACARAAPGLELTAGELALERGFQGGAHVAFDLSITGVPVGRVIRLTLLEDGAPQETNTVVVDELGDDCRLPARIVFEDDDYFWGVDLDGWRAVEIEVDTGAAVHTFARTLVADWY